MKEPAFVVQKHAATSLHYDFRLEIKGVMPSWAVPKGPSLDPANKRLALMTEDHDMAYRHFEGVIAEGEYGAGPVMVWDEGTYIPEVEVSKGVRKEITDFKGGQEVMSEGLEKGDLKFFLRGKKLKGSFALIRTRNVGPKNAWLLMKLADEYVERGYEASDFGKSAVSGMTLEQIEKEG